MLQFFDLHSHLLCEVDDGAKSPEEMYRMLEDSYEDGVRAICLTPHYSPYLFGDTFEPAQRAFALLREYVAEKHPDMRIYLGNELGYHHGAVEALDTGRCRTMNGSRYVLLDFPEGIPFFTLRDAVAAIRRAGYFVILAHAERYHCLVKELDWIKAFADEGGLIQLNASSYLGSWGKAAQKQWKKLVRRGLVHMIASDAHNTTTRPPQISACLPFLRKHCGEQTLQDLIWNNACRVMRDEPF